MTEGEIFPRIIFEDEQAVKTWCDVIGRNKSVAYITAKGEIVLVPNKSTRPLMFGYFKGDDTKTDTERIEIAKKLMDTCDVAYFIIKTFDWSEDRAMPEESPLRRFREELSKLKKD